MIERSIIGIPGAGVMLVPFQVQPELHVPVTVRHTLDSPHRLCSTQLYHETLSKCQVLL